eukprot:scaffold1171_cov108-Isochrysis_galbana.AAC.2
MSQPIPAVDGGEFRGGGRFRDLSQRAGEGMAVPCTGAGDTGAGSACGPSRDREVHPPNGSGGRACSLPRPLTGFAGCSSTPLPFRRSLAFRPPMMDAPLSSMSMVAACACRSWSVPAASRSLVASMRDRSLAWSLAPENRSSRMLSAEAALAARASTRCNALSRRPRSPSSDRYDRTRADRAVLCAFGRAPHSISSSSMTSLAASREQAAAAVGACRSSRCEADSAVSSLASVSEAWARYSSSY